MRRRTEKLLGQSASNTVGRGVVVSVGASTLFAALYFATPFLAPASAELVWAFRGLIAIPVITAALLVFRQWRLVGEVVRRVRKQPWLLLGVLICGVLIAAQLWVFSWAPLNGRGLQVALGYFLLPLILVIIGRFLYKDRLLWWQWLAAGIAAVGVGFEIVRVGSLSWETLLVALGYPVYFVLRRTIGTNHGGGMFWEFVLLAPLGAVFVVLDVVIDGHLIEVNPAFVWFAPLFGLWSGIASVCYILAARLLSISIFGLLSYLEPALLVVASLLIGERILAAEWPMYIAVWAAVAVLVTGGTIQLIRARRTLR